MSTIRILLPLLAFLRQASTQFSQYRRLLADFAARRLLRCLSILLRSQTWYISAAIPLRAHIIKFDSTGLFSQQTKLVLSIYNGLQQADAQRVHSVSSHPRDDGPP